MTRNPVELQRDARTIWQAGLNRVRPGPMIHHCFKSFPPDWLRAIEAAPRILVVGAGKAGGPMAVALEEVLSEHRQKIRGLVNIPEGETVLPQQIRLHPSRPAGSNHPTAAGVVGAEEMLQLVQSASAEDVAFCLLSGGGSALMPLPAEGITLADKQLLTKQLHGVGATINEMNCVRKHLSRIKGGRLAQAFRGQLFLSLILSDVVGDPLDVIASGPTVPDPTTLHDTISILQKYQLYDSLPDAIRHHLQKSESESPKSLSGHVHNIVIGSNTIALQACEHTASELGYAVLCLGPMVEGESSQVALVLAGIVRAIQQGVGPVPKPACILVGGETTVTLGAHPGKGGRNQELVLAMMVKLGMEAMPGVCILSAGTDGEDGPTDAAGAVVTVETYQRAMQRHLDLTRSLANHDAYHALDATDSLLKTGLTGTNVMDLRIILVT